MPARKQRRDLGLAIVSIALGLSGLYVVLTGSVPYAQPLPHPAAVRPIGIHEGYTLVGGLLMIAGAIYLWVQSRR